MGEEKKAKKEKKRERRRKARAISAEQRSDRLTAADVVARIEQVQEDLGDLLYEFRYLKRMNELADVAILAWRLDVLRARCDRFAQGGTWSTNE